MRPLLVIAALALGLAGCAQSSHTTSAATSGPGAAPTTATTPSTPTTTTTGSGSGTPPASVTGLSVSPQVGSPSSTLHFAITPTAHAASAPNGGQISSSLSVMGPQKSGCVGVHQEALPSSGSTTVALGPSQIGGNWCPGSYTARVLVLERPKCGPGQMCPQFIRVLASIGPVGFKISG